MSDYTELVKTLRERQGLLCYGEGACPKNCELLMNHGCYTKLHMDAAAAIEDLIESVHIRDKHLDELNHYIWKLEAANKELSEELLEAQAEKPHWISAELPPKGNGAFAACCVYDGKLYWFKAIYLDGKWLREVDGVELPANYWMEIPEPPQEVQE